MFTGGNAFFSLLFSPLFFIFVLIDVNRVPGSRVLIFFFFLTGPVRRNELDDAHLVYLVST